MIERYSRNEMARIWAEDNRLKIMLRVEEAFLEVLAAEKAIPAEEMKVLKSAMHRGLHERVKELEAQEKKLAAEYEQLEQGIYLCEVFIKTKVNMLTDKINDKFQNVRFRLFIEQQNGGVKEDCEVMIPAEGGRMVPYVFSNNAARINAGLEIIDALSTHWGITMPVFVDNAESVTRLLNMNTQVIRLVVSEADKTLRLEV